MLRVFFNDVQAADEVRGLDTLEESLELNLELKGYLYQISGAIIIQGDDYDNFIALYDSEYCQDVTVIIQYSDDFGNSWETKARGIIKLAGVKWDRIRRQAECPITDDSYLSRINNNRNTKFTLGNYNGIVLSKNGVDVSDRAVYHSDIEFFSPFRGRYFANEAQYFKSDPPFPASEGDDLIQMQPPGRTGIFIYDALNLIIGMMTDDEVDFASDYYTYSLVSPLDANEDAFCALFSGQSIKHGSLYPTLTFSEFFSDLHKLSNVWFGLEIGSNGKPVFRVENEDYFRQNNSSIYFDSIESLIETIDLRKIYSKVIVGCSQSPGDFPVGEIKLIQQMQEEFPLSGTCNVDNTLELRLQKLIISTNAIASVLPSISGFSTGSLVHRKYTTEETTAGPNQKLTDTSIGFQETLIQMGFLITNTVTNEWSYITGIPDNNNILIFDEIFDVDNTGATKNYEIYKPSDNDSLLDEVFLVQLDRQTYEDFSILAASQSVIDPPNDIYIYNPTFTNASVITRHMGGVAQSIVNSLTDGQDEFSAELDVDTVLNNTTYFQTTDQTNYRRVRFNDDTNAPFFDTNGNYDALTGIYTAPSPGYYHGLTALEFTNTSGETFSQQVELLRISASGQVIESESEVTTISGSYTFNLDRVFYLDEGETLQVWVKKPFGLSGIWLNQYVDWDEFQPGGFGSGYGCRGLGDTTFGVDELINGGGEVPASTPDDARLLNIESELSITRGDFDSIIANPFKYYHLLYAENTAVTGYIGRVSRGILSGEATVNLFKKKDGV